MPGALADNPGFIESAAASVNNDIRTQLEAVFREVFDDDTLALANGIDRDSFEPWDSLGHVRLVSAVEEAFGVSLTLDEIEAMSTADQIAALLASKS